MFFTHDVAATAEMQIDKWTAVGFPVIGILVSLSAMMREMHVERGVCKLSGMIYNKFQMVCLASIKWKNGRR